MIDLPSTFTNIWLFTQTNSIELMISSMKHTFTILEFPFVLRSEVEVRSNALIKRIMLMQGAFVFYHNVYRLLQTTIV